MQIGCENCTKCFSGCKSAFLAEYLEGGAEKCENFLEESDQQVVYKNMEKYISEMKDKLAEEGIYI